MVNRTLPLQRATSSIVSESSCPIAVPHYRLVKAKKFGLEEKARERSFAPRQDASNLGTLFGEGSYKFNQFETMQEEMHRNPDVFAAEVENLVSSS